jgi:ribonucleotide reductase alpha subunit
MVLEKGKKHGFRNAQATVLAPTGTISFMMDCDTTGIEPDIALVKYKQMAGGGMMKIINRSLSLGLKTLGYDDASVQAEIRSKVLQASKIPICLSSTAPSNRLRGPAASVGELTSK